MAAAPIALFVYRRPDHTLRCLERLRANPPAAESDLFVFSDGPKNQEAAEGVERVRGHFRRLQGFRSVTVTERETNLGLARSIVTGVTEIVERFGKVIVMEDDLVTSPHFLKFMNDGLDFYHDEERVASIHGYSYPVKGQLPETYFLRGADCWGWATWKRAWGLFNHDGSALLAKLRAQGLERVFDRNGAYPYVRMLEDQIAGRNDSWAVRWYASAFLAGKFTLYPGRSMVLNIGMDALGTHCDENSGAFDVKVADKPASIQSIPIREEPLILGALDGFFNSLRPSLARRVANRIKGLVNALAG